MGKYLLLQGKRAMKYLPAALCAVLVLVSMLLAGYRIMLDREETGEQNTKVKIALTGDMDDPFLQMGLTMLKTMDSTQYSIEILSMDLQSAQQALADRQINAYVRIPDGFMDNALRGDVAPLEFVSHRDSADLAAVFKREMTQVITTMAVEAQRGVYGLMNTMRQNALDGVGDTTDEAAMAAIQMVLARDRMYTVKVLGISEGLGLGETLLSGLSVLLILLACLPFAPLLVRRETALNRVMAAKGRPVWLQLLCEFLAFFAALTVLALVALLAYWLATVCSLAELLTFGQIWKLMLYLLPVLLSMSAFSFLLYALTGELISGVLLQFFGSVAMCFVCGCIYPVSFFPVKLQQLAAFLPAGVARTWMTGAAGETVWSALWPLLGYCGLFLGISLLLGSFRISRKQR